MPVVPLPRVRRLGSLYLLATGLHAAQLLGSGHWMMAPLVLLLGAATLFAMRRLSPRDAGAARRLLVAADGRLHVATFRGTVEPVTLGGESLWLGPAVLLVLHAPGRTHRLLLGRGNLEPVALSTLRRRLRGAAAPAALDTVVDSRTLSGHDRSLVEQLSSGIPLRGS